MKRSLAVKILGIACAAVVALIAGTAQAAIITNTCTTTYTAINFPGSWVASGWDTVSVTTDTQPTIIVKKYVKNLRLGYEADSGVMALSGDTIEFRIVWSNEGGATADTVTLADYLPTSITYISGSLGDTEANCDTPGTAVYTAGNSSILYVVKGVRGTNPGPYADGQIKFRAVVW